MSIGFTLQDSRDTGEMAREVFSYFGAPYVVKPITEGSGRGIRVAQSVLELPDVLADILDEYGSALVQEFVVGDEVIVGLIDGFREQEMYALSPALVARKSPYTIYAPEAHLSGAVQHVVPSPFSNEIKEEMMHASKIAYQALGLSGAADADLIMTRRGPYVLEMNASPILHEQGSFQKMLESSGSSLREYLVHALSRVGTGQR